MAWDAVEEADPSTTSLEGLSKTWEDTEILRDNLLKRGSLLVWPEPKLTGVINFHTMAPNGRCLECVLQLWCPQVSEAKTVNIDQIRFEVGVVETANIQLLENGSCLGSHWLT